MSKESELMKQFSRIRPQVNVTRCIVKDGLLTLTILNPEHTDDDRNNIIDLEEITFGEAQKIITNKYDRSIDLEMRKHLFAIGVILLFA